MTQAQAFELLKLPKGPFRAFLLAGLFGDIDRDGELDHRGIEHFQKYGTQWRADLGTRILSEEMLNSVGPGNELQPIGTRTQIQIFGSSEEDPDMDMGWVAQFYLRHNSYYFSEPYALGINAPTGLKLNEPLTTIWEEKQLTMFPDPQGSLAMIQVDGGPRSGNSERGVEDAYDAVAGVLDVLSFQHDIPLHIAHAISIGVPSGTINIEAQRHARSVQIGRKEVNTFIRPAPEHIHAFALYRDGLSASNPFHQFLSFWKCYENCMKIREEMRRESGSNDRGSLTHDVKVPEVFPNSFAFNDLAGKRFGTAKSAMESHLRHAIAHGSLSGRRVRTAATSEDYFFVKNHIPVVRYMASTVLENLLHLASKR